MSTARTSPSPALLHQQLTQKAQELQHELEGFPVLDLVQTYADAAAQASSAPALLASADAASSSFLMAQACLSSWQSALDEAIGSYPPDSDDAHQRLRDKQLRARDAIAHIRSMLVTVECQRAKMTG